MVNKKKLVRDFEIDQVASNVKRDIEVEEMIYGSRKINGK